MVEERDDLAIKRYEELYNLARAGHSAELQRFDGVEAKVARYVSLLVVVLGVGAVGAGEFAVALTKLSSTTVCSSSGSAIDLGFHS